MALERTSTLNMGAAGSLRNYAVSLPGRQYCYILIAVRIEHFVNVVS